MATEKRPLTPDELAFIDQMSRAAAEGTLYDVLGVHGGSTAAEVEASYMELARRWHPDRFYSRDAGRHTGTIDDNFAFATRAYRTLRDASKRSAYDREIAAQGQYPPPPPKSTTAPTATSTYSSPARNSGERTSGERLSPRAAPPPPVEEVGHEVSFRPGSMPEFTRPKAKAPPAVAKHLQAIRDQKLKAERHYEAGKKEFEAGQFGKAESALFMAMSIDPRNAGYKDLFEQARVKAREGKARGLVQQAEAAENYGRIKEAISLLKQAVECDPPEAAPFYKLGQLLRTHDDDDRAALTNLRKAALKEPRKASFRLALAEMYASINLRANAVREAQAVLELEPKNEAAKALLKKLK